MGECKAEQAVEKISAYLKNKNQGKQISAWLSMNKDSEINSRLPNRKVEGKNINHTGGAYGADSIWAKLLRPFGVVNNHYRPTIDGKIKRLGELTKAGDNVINITVEEEEEGNYLNALLGNGTGSLNNRNYVQVRNADKVFAVAPLNPVTGWVDGGTGSAVRMANYLGKNVYVLNTNDAKWYEYKGRSYKEMREYPDMSGNIAAVGTRRIEAYNTPQGKAETLPTATPVLEQMQNTVNATFNNGDKKVKHYDMNSIMNKINQFSQRTASPNVKIVTKIFDNANNKNIVTAFRVNKNKTLLQNLKDSNAIGNPFDWNKYGTGEATRLFAEWLINGKNEVNEKLATNAYRQAIIDKIPELRGKTIEYYKELNRPSHATVLDYFLNEYAETTAKKPYRNNVSSYSEGLEFALTNPILTTPGKYIRSPKGYKDENGNFKQWSKSQKEWIDYFKAKPIEYRGEEYLDVESAYQHNKGEHLTGNARDDYDLKLMTDLIKIKFKTYDKLLNEVTNGGGLNYLNTLTHNVRNNGNRWETNGKDMFLTALKQAYIEVVGINDPQNSQTSTTGLVPVGPYNLKVVPNFIDTEQANYIANKVEELINDSSIDKVSNKFNFSRHIAITFGPVDYTYSLGRNETVTHKAKPIHAWMEALARRTERKDSKPEGYYNQVLINKFVETGIGERPNGENIKHTDAETPYIDENGNVGSVAIISIGDTVEEHEFSDKFKGGNEVKAHAIDKSLVVMSSGKMYHYVAPASGVRYSITYRHVPDNRLPENLTKEKKRSNDNLELITPEDIKEINDRITSNDITGCN